MTATRAPGQYQEVLAILRELPKADADYVLSFLLAAERRIDRMRRTIVLEEQELREYREELRDKCRTQLEKAQADFARRAAELSALSHEERKRHRAKITAVYERILKLLANDSLGEQNPTLAETLRALLKEFEELFRKCSIDTTEG